MPQEIPLYTPSVSDLERRYINRVLQEAKSTIASELEDKAVAYFGAQYALAVDSGTAALHLAMCALDLKRGDKVVCSVNSFPDLPEVVRHFDAEPIFVDCESERYAIDLDKLEQTLSKNQSKKLRAVIVSHPAGLATDLDRLYAIAQSHKVKVIEDASDAMGASYQGKKIGQTGADMVIFSFEPRLQQSLADGGLLVTDDPALYKRAKLFRTHAMHSSEGGTYEEVEYLYDVVDIGWKYDMSALSAAFCLAQFERLDQSIERRRKIVSIYRKELKGLEHIKLPVVHEGHAYRQFIIEIDKNRDHFARELKKEGINIGLHYIPLHFMEYYKKKYKLKVFDFPVALGVYQRMMSLPLYSSMSDDQVNRVCQAVRKVAAAHV
jgi:perosamine synthetase